MDPRLAVGQARRDPEIQVHHYDEHTVIPRQNMSVHYEAPFPYLLLGDDQAVLVDSGATSQRGFFPLRVTVNRLLAGWSHHLPAAGATLGDGCRRPSGAARAVLEIGDTPGVHPFERFVVYHGTPARHFA